MTDFRIFVKLLVVMTVVSIGTMAITAGFGYVYALRGREHVLIQVAARYQQAILSVLKTYEFHSKEHPFETELSVPDTALNATIHLVQHIASAKGPRGDIELPLAILRGKTIHYITHQPDANKNKIRLGSHLAVAMQLALQGKTGTIRGLDYQGYKVIAAYASVGETGMGVVAKSRISGISFRFLKGIGIATIPVFILVFFGVFYFSKITNYIIKTLQKDNARYRQLAKEIKITNKKLAENEQQLQCFFDATFEGFAITENGIFLNLNNAFAEMVGYKVKELIGKSIAVLVYPDDLKIVRENIRSHSTEKYELRVTHKKGHIVYIKVRAQMADLQGREVRITMVHDLTEQKKSVAALKELQAREQHASKMEAIGNFASGIAHDLNNSFTPILGCCELLLIKLKENDPRRENVLTILSAVETASSLVGRIQSFTRQEADPWAVTPLRLNECLDEAFKFLRSMTPTSVIIEMEVEKNLDLVLITDIAVRQILMNLVKNSTHAMVNKEGRINIEVSNETILVERYGIAPGRYVKIEVEDNGCGMSETILERALDPYYTTKKDQGGSGLGLSIVSGIVKNYGGLIFLESEEDLGTKITIHMPAAIENTGTKGYAEKQAPITMGNGQRVLFVDDEEGITDVASQILDSLNYDVDVFNDSLAALRIFSQNPTAYDVLITDMTMPDMSGISLIQEIKAINPEIKVVLISGLGTNGRYSADLFSNLINVYLQKPATRQQYAEALETVFKD